MRQEKKYELILQILRDASGPLTSRQIAEVLFVSGNEVSERSVRMYLKQMEEDGLLERRGRRGCILNDDGIAATRSMRMVQRVGLLSARIDQMTYRMTFDLERRIGDVVVNMSVLPPQQLSEYFDEIAEVFRQSYAVGDRLALLTPGEVVGEVEVSEGNVGFCTVCSVTLNGILLKHGIPTHSRFGGLLAVRDGRAERFLELIEYEGTSIDPLEVFIRSGMTDYRGAIKTGTGRIGASFREFPAESREIVHTVSQRMREIGLNTVMEIGHPGQPVLGIPVSDGRVGAIVIGGLNPIAILEEEGFRVESRALSGLLEYSRLIRCTDAASVLNRLM